MKTRNRSATMLIVACTKLWITRSATYVRLLNQLLRILENLFSGCAQIGNDVIHDYAIRVR